MTEQAVDHRYRTVAELAEHLGVSVHVCYRNIGSGLWKVSRTSPSPKAPIRVSPAQTAAIEEQMKANGERDPRPQQSAQSDARTAAIDRGLRRLKR